MNLLRPLAIRQTLKKALKNFIKKKDSSYCQQLRKSLAFNNIGDTEENAYDIGDIVSLSIFFV